MEVLIALVILAIALLAVVKSMNSSVRNTYRIKNSLSAHWVAMNIASELQLSLLPLPKEGVIEGDMNLLGQQWHWVVGDDGGQTPHFQRSYVNVLLDGKQYQHLVVVVSKSNE